MGSDGHGREDLKPSRLFEEFCASKESRGSSKSLKERVIMWGDAEDNVDCIAVTELVREQVTVRKQSPSYINDALPMHQLT